MNQIGNEGTSYLAESLKINSTLTSLNLYGKLFHLFEIISQLETGNQIGKEGTSYLAESLKVNSTLTSLNLSGKLFHLFELFLTVGNKRMKLGMKEPHILQNHSRSIPPSHH